MKIAEGITGKAKLEKEPEEESKKKQTGSCRECAQAFCVNPYAMIYYCDALKTTKRREESCELFERRENA